MNQSLVEFRGRLTSDNEFYRKFKDLETAAEIIRLAEEEGYHFTVDELIGETELSNEELASAAGGVFTSSISGDVTPYAGLVNR